MTRSRALPSTLLPLVALTAALAAIGACGTNTPGSNPKVVSTVPADGALGVSPNTEVVVRFDRAMQAASLTVSTTGSTCGGTLQLSADDFATCLPFAASPTTSSGGAAFHALPAQPLALGASYRLKVKAGVSSAQGRVLLQDFVMPDGFTVGAAPTPTPTPGAYSHTIIIDGTNDFVDADEKLATTSSSAGYDAWVSWDASNFYFALQGADVNAAVNPQFKWVVAYFGGAGGTTAGVTYDDLGNATAQQPTLPFAAKWHMAWRVDGNLTQALVWNGAAWTTTAWDFSGDIFRSGTFVEFAVPRARVGAPAQLPFVMSMVNEEPTHEATYAGVPADAWVMDGPDPDFAHDFEFDLDGVTAPAATAEQ